MEENENSVEEMNKRVEIKDEVKKDENKIAVVGIAKKESRLLPIGAAVLTEEVRDEVPVGKTTGDGHSACLEEGTVHVFEDVMALPTPLLKYVAGSISDDGIEHSSYTGADIANSDGKGPEIPANDGD